MRTHNHDQADWLASGSDVKTRGATTASGGRPLVSVLLALQQKAGNRAVSRALAGARTPTTDTVQRCGGLSFRECPCHELERAEESRSVVDGQSVLMERKGHVSPTGDSVLVQRQPAAGSASKDLLQKLLERVLREGVAYDAKKGWMVGGVPLKEIPRGVEVISKLTKGDIQGVIEMFKPRDRRERERIRQEVIELRKQFELLIPREERERQRARERKELAAEASKRLGLPSAAPAQSARRSFQLPDAALHPEELRLGTTTYSILDRFQLASSTLEPLHRRQLRDMARQASADPGARIQIVGHTDTSGPEAFNLGLAERRAQAVRDYLEKQGVSSNTIESVTGMGEAAPRVEEHTEDDRAQNRRVEIFYRAGIRERHPQLLRPPQRPAVLDLGD